MTDTFNEGDLIEATKGDTVIRGRLVPATDSHGDPLPPQADLWLVVENWPAPQTDDNPRHRTTFVDALGLYGWTVTVIEKAAPALPTEPGHYLRDGWDCVYTLSPVEQWWYGNSQRRVEEMADNGPLTRLEPVADTAKKVLAEVRNRAITGNSDTMTIRHLVLENIATDFGVTS